MTVSRLWLTTQKPKFIEIHNICSNWLLLQSIKGTCFQQMLNISVNFDFCFMKKLWDLAHEKLVNIQGGHHVGTNIHGWQPYLKIAIYVLKSANGGLLCRPLYLHTRTLLHIFTFQNHKTENLFMYWYETVVKEIKSWVMKHADVIHGWALTYYKT